MGVNALSLNSGKSAERERKPVVNLQQNPLEEGIGMEKVSINNSMIGCCWQNPIKHDLLGWIFKGFTQQELIDLEILFERNTLRVRRLKLRNSSTNIANCRSKKSEIDSQYCIHHTVHDGDTWLDSWFLLPLETSIHG